MEKKYMISCGLAFALALCVLAGALCAFVPSSAYAGTRSHSPGLMEPVTSDLQPLPGSQSGGFDTGAPPPPPLPDVLKERIESQSKAPYISSATVLEAKAGETGMIELVLHGGEDKDRLVGAYTSWADSVSVLLYSRLWQGTSGNGGDGAELVPRSVEKLALDPGVTARFGDGKQPGFVLQMNGVKRDLHKGQFFPLVLVFDKGGAVTYNVLVVRKKK